MKVNALQEGLFCIDANHQAIPYDENQTIKNSLIVGIQPFLVRSNGYNIIFDTGLGRKNSDGVLQLHTNLIKYNLSCYDIHYVVLSHLHHDHVKGIAFKNLDNRLELTFPNATYFLNQTDFLANIQNEKTEKEIIEKLLFLTNETQACKFFQNSDTALLHFIKCQQTDAHCINHFVFWVNENEKIFFYGADDAPQLIQMQRKFLTKYDSNPVLANDLRKQWWVEGQEKKWTFLFYHDTKTPIYPIF